MGGTHELLAAVACLEVDIREILVVKVINLNVGEATLDQTQDLEVPRTKVGMVEACLGTKHRTQEALASPSRSPRTPCSTRARVILDKGEVCLEVDSNNSRNLNLKLQILDQEDRTLGPVAPQEEGCLGRTNPTLELREEGIEVGRTPCSILGEEVILDNRSLSTINPNKTSPQTSNNLRVPSIQEVVLLLHRIAEEACLGMEVSRPILDQEEVAHSHNNQTLVLEVRTPCSEVASNSRILEAGSNSLNSHRLLEDSLEEMAGKATQEGMLIRELGIREVDLSSISNLSNNQEVINRTKADIKILEEEDAVVDEAEGEAEEAEVAEVAVEVVEEDSEVILVEVAVCRSLHRIISVLSSSKRRSIRDK